MNTSTISNRLTRSIHRLQFETLERRNMLAVDLSAVSFTDVLHSNLIFEPGESVPVGQQYELLGHLTGLGENESYQLTGTETDQLGFTHFRYQQQYFGIPVEGGIYTVHARNGQVESLSGDRISFDPVDAAPTLHSRDALIFALSHVEERLRESIPDHSITGHASNPVDVSGGKLRYVWQTSNGQLRPQDLPDSELVFLQTIDNQITLTHKFDIYVTNPLFRSYVFVDASSGDIVGESERIHTIDTPANGTSLYNGIVNFTSDQLGPASYRLQTTGNLARTFDMNEGEDYDLATDIVSGTTSFNDPDHTIGVQAHWGGESSVLYYRNVHGRDSFNDAGATVDMYVSLSVGYNNAFWDGSSLSFGDGDGVNFNPLVSIDVIAHELTHGVTEYSANLNYVGESGALNESFSDVFGEATEYYTTGSSNWITGDHITIGGGGIRNFADPKFLGDPDTYLGEYWVTGSQDNGGVHTNSSVHNKWFYLVSEGEVGTNDNGDAYNVTGIGIEDAEQIAYRNLTVYLTPGSQYLDARFGSIQSAIDLFGLDSPQHLTVEAAWDAVGVYGVEIKFFPTAVEVSGSLIYSDTQSGSIFIDGISLESTIKLDAGQTIALRASSESLVAALEIRDPNGMLIGSSNGSVVGEGVVLGATTVSIPGEYSIFVGNMFGTTGEFTLDLLLNAEFELELSDGITNDSLAVAQDIDSSAIILGNSPSSDANRLGVLGFLGQGYQFVAGDNFESGTFGSQWQLSSSDAGGRIRIVPPPGSGAAVGANAMIMDVDTDGIYNLNEAVLSADLTGYDDLVFSFWLAEWLDENDYLPTSFTGSANGDGVSISDDGITWHTILTDIATAFGDYRYFEFDLVAEAANAGLTLGPDFKIKFQQYDNGRLFNDGLGYDEIFINVPVLAEDWYSFTVDANETVSLLADQVSGAGSILLELFDASGNILLTGDSFEAQSSISQFTNTGSTATFYTRVTGSIGQYAMVVTRGADFDIEPNGSATPRDITNLDGALGSVSTTQLLAAEPDDFIQGSILDNLFEGITLSNQVTGGSVYAAAANIFDAPTGTLVFGPEWGASDGWRQFDDELRVDFAELQSFVSIEVGSDDPSDRGRLQAYSSTGVLLAETTSDALPEGASQTISIDRSTADIAYVLAFGVGTDITPMDNLKYLDYLNDQDVYVVNAVVGDELYFEGILPGAGPFEFHNGLDKPAGSDLRMELFDPSGNLIGSDSTLLSHVAAQSGQYKLIVFSNEGNGEYYISRNASTGELKFDFGPAGQAVAVDFVGVEDDAYDPLVGYGWTSRRAFAVQNHSRGNELTGDGFRAANARFAVDVADGDYQVLVHIGFALHLDTVRITVEDSSHVFQPQPNSIQTYMASVTDGQMNLLFHGEFGLDSVIRVSGLEIIPVSSLTGQSGGGRNATAATFDRAVMDFAVKRDPMIDSTVRMNSPKTQQFLDRSFAGVTPLAMTPLPGMSRDLNVAGLSRHVSDTARRLILEEGDEYVVPDNDTGLAVIDQAVSGIAFLL